MRRSSLGLALVGLALAVPATASAKQPKAAAADLSPTVCMGQHLLSSFRRARTALGPRCVGP